MVSYPSRMPTYCKRHRTRDFIYMQKSRRRGPIFFSLLFNLVFFSWQLSLSFLTYSPVSWYLRYLKCVVAKLNLIRLKIILHTLYKLWKFQWLYREIQYPRIQGTDEYNYLGLKMPNTSWKASTVLGEITNIATMGSLT